MDKDQFDGLAKQIGGLFKELGQLLQDLDAQLDCVLDKASQVTRTSDSPTTPTVYREFDIYDSLPTHILETSQPAWQLAYQAYANELVAAGKSGDTIRHYIEFVHRILSQTMTSRLVDIVAPNNTDASVTTRFGWTVKPKNIVLEVGAPTIDFEKIEYTQELLGTVTALVSTIDDFIMKLIYTSANHKTIPQQSTADAYFHRLASLLTQEAHELTGPFKADPWVIVSPQIGSMLKLCPNVTVYKGVYAFPSRLHLLGTLNGIDVFVDTAELLQPDDLALIGFKNSEKLHSGVIYVPRSPVQQISGVGTFTHIGYIAPDIDPDVDTKRYTLLKLF